VAIVCGSAEAIFWIVMPPVPTRKCTRVAAAGPGWTKLSLSSRVR
jgi:hypothetical protein